MRGMLWLCGVAGLAVACGDGGRQVRAHFESGALKAEGREVRATDGTWKKSGPFRSWHENGAPASQGSYRADTASGTWTHWYPDGALQARGCFLFGEREGVWIERLPDGSLDREASGVYEQGRKIDDFLIDGSLEEVYSANRLRERVNYVDGLRHGPATTWFPNGSKRSEGEYVRGAKSGPWTYWNEDGSVDARLSGVYAGWDKLSE